MWRIRLGLLISLISCTVMADSIGIDIEEAVSERFQAEGLEAALAFTSGQLTLSIKADALMLPPPLNRVSQVDFHCAVFRFQSESWHCEQGELAFEHNILGSQKLSIQLTASQLDSTFSLDFSGLRFAGGLWKSDVDWQQGQWQLAMTGQAIDTDKLNHQMQTFFPEILPVLDIQGDMSMDATLQGHHTALQSVTAGIGIQSLALSDADGALAAENLSGQFKFNASRQTGEWQWQKQGQLNNGELYISPIYLDINAYPLSLSAQGHWQSESNQLAVSHWQFEQQSVLQAEGELTLDEGQLAMLQAEIASQEVQPLYQVWLQPFVFDTAVDDAQLEGDLRASLDWQAALYDLNLQLGDITIEDNQQRFDISGLDGNLAWTNREHDLPIHLRWQSAGLYQIELGPAELAATASKNRLTLSESIFLPVLDGELQLDKFQLVYPPDDSVNWSFEGLLKPVSMPVLSEALGWPLLQGKLSGVIPSVRYQNQQVDVDGALMVKVFDGTAVIRDLQLIQPFGYVPHLSANVDIDELDLETLTTTFDFGRISGTLNGYLHDLQLANWRPEQFDAWFVTDESADTKRRISQRAVNNLSQLGGGPSALLSRSFLRFFDDFSYQRLGLGCRLSRGVCEMRGVSDAEQGYHIVEGGGLPPWINVIGHNRRVDWSVLIERLQAVSQSDGPVIQ